MGPRCSFCGATVGPFLEVEGAFRLLIAATARPPAATILLPTPP